LDGEVVKLLVQNWFIFVVALLQCAAAAQYFCQGEWRLGLCNLLIGLSSFVFSLVGKSL